MGPMATASLSKPAQGVGAVGPVGVSEQWEVGKQEHMLKDRGDGKLLEAIGRLERAGEH